LAEVVSAPPKALTAVGVDERRAAADLEFRGQGVPGTVYLIVNAIWVADQVSGLTTILSGLRTSIFCGCSERLSCCSSLSTNVKPGRTMLTNRLHTLFATEKFVFDP